MGDASIETSASAMGSTKTYMNALCDRTYKKVRAGYPWHKVPPWLQTRDRRMSGRRGTVTGSESNRALKARRWLSEHWTRP